MKEPFLIGTGIKFQALEVFTVDTRSTGGKVGSYDFAASANQTNYKVLSIRPIWFEECRIPDTATAVQLQNATLTLRTPKGDYVANHVPLLALSEQLAWLTFQRPIVWEPRFIDWRQCSVNLVAPFAGLVRIQVLYERPR